MNAEVSLGPVGTRAGGAASAGPSDAGSDETHMGRAQTVAASPPTVPGERLEADDDSARPADRRHLWIRAKHRRERFNGACMGVRHTQLDTHVIS